MSDQPINIDAPSYYVLPDGTELREVIRRFRGDYKTAEHLVQAVIEYAIRAGRKPDVTMVEDMRKVVRCAQQAVNILEGRHVSDNGDPPTACGTPDLSRVVGMLTQHGVVHLYERKDDLRAAMDSPDGWDRVMWTDGVQLHAADESTLAPTPPPDSRLRRAAVAMLAAMRGPHGPSWSSVPAGNAPNHGHSVPGVWDQSNDPDRAGKPCEWCAAWREFVAAVEGEPTPTPPPEPERPSITLPVVFAGEKTARSGLYIELDSRGIPRRALVGEGYEADSTLLGPVPPACEWPTKPEGKLETEEA